MCDRDSWCNLRDLLVFHSMSCSLISRCLVKWPDSHSTRNRAWPPWKYYFCAVNKISVCLRGSVSKMQTENLTYRNNGTGLEKNHINWYNTHPPPQDFPGPLTPHPPGNSNPFRGGGGMDIFWNHTLWQWFGYQILTSIKFCKHLLWTFPRIMKGLRNHIKNLNEVGLKTQLCLVIFNPLLEYMLMNILSHVWHITSLYRVRGLTLLFVLACL